VILAGFLEGPGLWAGPSEAIVTTEAEALAWIKRYAENGFRQIKLYNLVQQDLVPVIAEETHKRGMRLSGHVPRGLSTPAAVRLGFDEINHAAFLFSTFYPESLYIPTMRAYSTVSQIAAANIDVDGPEVTALIDLLKEKGTVIDGTWQLWLSGGAPAGLGIPSASADSTAARINNAYIRMLKRVYDAGIPLVPGTDGSSFNGELELYERAGIPAPQVLRIATIVSARAMADDKDYGSIAPGKVADIIIVDGRPAERVADLRKVERVMRAGRVYDVKALQAATR
jgi:imidazolonepropionase-like amidohydrolase